MWTDSSSSSQVGDLALVKKKRVPPRTRANHFGRSLTLGVTSLTISVLGLGLLDLLSGRTCGRTSVDRYLNSMFRSVWVVK